MAKLGELKSLLLAQRAKDSEPGPRKAASKSAAGATANLCKTVTPKPAESDVDLALAFADVKRLPRANRARLGGPEPSAIPRQRIADEEAALLASKYGAEPSPDRWDVGQEPDGGQTFLRPGLGSDVLSKLRRGHWSLQGEIDLHGCNRDEARDRLTDFLLDARAHGSRCVRVIHGKGLSSPGKEPVLKGKVRGWLSQRDDVLAYCEAPPHAGGGGAVLVLLRGS